MKVYVIIGEAINGDHFVSGVVSDIEMAKRTDIVPDMGWEEFELDSLEIIEEITEMEEFIISEDAR